MLIKNLINNLCQQSIGVRNLKTTDLKDFFEFVGDYNNDASESLENANEALNTFIAGDEVFGITYDNKLVGTIGIHPSSIEGFKYGFELGYVVAKGYRNRNIASTAVSLVKKALFDNLSIDYLVIKLPTNLNESRIVAEKNSFVHYNDECTSIVRENVNVSIYILTRRRYLFYRNELLALFDAKTLEQIDTKYSRIDVVPENYVFGVVDIILKNTKYNKYLVTRRAKEKTFSGFYEITGGAMQYQEKALDSAKRELKEETGITAYSYDYLESATSRRCVYYTYIAYTDCELDSVVLQDGETDDYKWLSLDKFQALINSDLFVPSCQKRIYKLIKEFK